MEIKKRALHALFGPGGLLRHMSFPGGRENQDEQQPPDRVVSP